MNRLEINPDNEKYYSKEFIQGYKCGTKSQLDADAKVLKQIRVELEDCIRHSQYFTTVKACCGVRDDVLRVIDKYR